MAVYVLLNGEEVLKKDARISPFDNGFLFGDAVYETLLIHNGKLCFFLDHWNRLQISLQKLGITLPEYCDTPEKMEGLCERIRQKNSISRGRLRITISRGENGFDFTSSPSPTVLHSISPLEAYPTQYYEKGVDVMTLEEKRAVPDIKSTNFLASILGQRALAQTDCFEALFVNQQGFFREGTISNVFGLSGKKMIIAPRNTVLPGTLQAVVEKVFTENGYTVEEQNFTISDVFESFDELCVSNSLFGVLPIKSIDGRDFQSDFRVTKKLFGPNFFNQYL